nr:unnamed protein product [Spirometra erinaceieuropaei]
MSLYSAISESNNTRRHVDSPGSVASEFEASLRRIRNNRKAYESLQEEASLALARQLLLEAGVDEDSLDSNVSEEKENFRLTSASPGLLASSSTSFCASKSAKPHNPLSRQKTKELTAFFRPTRSTSKCSEVSNIPSSCPTAYGPGDSLSDTTERCYSGRPHGFLSHSLSAEMSTKAYSVNKDAFLL